ncbi:hypothetical protein DRW41_05385 [Neobacillus piezotolerans]|uniref:Uncharacterized protein n=1 Tax=Neobacillus piezotolerans TaxID=2259171 RepID=A0A3D8GSG7_9BACI|nr:hypothetical protein [Neobacillus piezotolerans]RDU37287.1 hypothetical protein DRW41_05385 [Neobacillus piezotolerans]
MEASFQEVASTQLQEFQKGLPSPEEERLKRFNEIVGRRKIERILENEALSLWATKPESERFKKVGWFHKEEDRNKKVQSIKSYIDYHF